MARRLFLAYRLFEGQILAYRLFGGVVPDLAQINIFGSFGAAAQNLWVTADGLIDYTAILPKLWPMALGTDEGVRRNAGGNEGASTSIVWLG